MLKQMGELVMVWGLAAILWSGLGSGTWAGQNSRQASQPVAEPDSVVLAAIGEPDSRRISSQATKDQVSQGSQLHVLCWELLNQDIYVYRYNMEGLDWRQIRDQREVRKNASKNQKHLKLNITSLTAGNSVSQSLSPVFIKQARLLMRDPDGKVSQLTPQANQEDLVAIPKGDEMNGRYILSAQLNLGKMDYNQDGLEETVSLYAKTFVLHYREDLSLGSSPNVFFNDTENLAFEIGPVVNNAKNKYGGGMQRPHREYEMMVKYKNEPLPGAKVSVYVEGGGWQGRFITDADGVFTIMPTDDRFGDKEWQRYIYVAEHPDPGDGSYHVATFPVIVNKNRPEWRSKATGFGFWVIIGSALILLMVAGLSWRKRHQDKRSLVVFESCRIKKD
ncbi:MAG: hypothetical protein PVG60_01005 [Desulfarculaceae bacterium]|jgi:hypothetical protein